MEIHRDGSARAGLFQAGNDFSRFFRVAITSNKGEPATFGQDPGNFAENNVKVGEEMEDTRGDGMIEDSVTEQVGGRQSGRDGEDRQ